MWSGHILPVSTKSLPNTSNRIGQGTKHTQPQSHWSVVWSATICKYIWWGSSSNKELERREWGVHPIQDSFLARLNHCKDHTCTPCHNHDLAITMTLCSIYGSVILTGLWASIGVTCSYSSYPFLCTLDTTDYKSVYVIMTASGQQGVPLGNCRAHKLEGG